MTSEILEGIQQAFTLHYGEIEAAAYAEWPEMTFYDASGIMGALATNLHRYRRSPDERFILWATARVKRQARRFKLLTDLFTKNHSLLYAAIERGLYRAPVDWSQEPADHEADIYLHLLQNPRKIDQLIAPKKAKSSTMLYSLAKSRMRAVRALRSDRRALTAKWMADLLDSGMTGNKPEPKSKDGYEKKVMRYEMAGTR